MALILNIETSTEVCSVGLSRDGETVALKENKEGLNHSSLLSLFIDDILKENSLTARDLDAVAISMGPGSYTGLRIGVSTAKGVCYGAEIPLIAVSTLQAVAQPVHELANKNGLLDSPESAWFCPMTDARRMEVFCAFYDNNNTLKKDIAAEIIDNESFLDILNEREVVFFGNGADKCKEAITHKNAKFIDDILPTAKNMAKIAEDHFAKKEFADVAYFEPFYLKDFVATTPKKKVL
jgi:tRNA threonylcarbamoyladenosine biosynthesis protein TsaB